MNSPFSQKILDLREEPGELEQLYRQHPDDFALALREALAIDKASIALRIWEARLFFPETQLPAAEQSQRISDRTTVWVLVLLCLASGTVAKLPAIFGFDEYMFYERNVSFFFLPAIAAYFTARRGLSWKYLSIIAAVFVLAVVAINAYPPLYEGARRYDRSASNQLAALHLPFFLWAIAGLAFAGERWRDVETRVAYLRLTGEAIIYVALIVITGGLMTGLTIGLFEAINIKIQRWYFDWVVLYGACSAPIVATHFASTRTRSGSTIAPLIARVFAPLALLTLIGYLITIVVQQRSPFSDREFLVVFNGMLGCVLGISVLSICERKPSRFFDIVLSALVLVAIVIDLVALSAIIYRLASFGITPNRVATLGANILALANLLGILVTFAPSTWRPHDAGNAKIWIARFLPVYVVWTAIVVFLFPLLFQFR